MSKKIKNKKQKKSKFVLVVIIIICLIIGGYYFYNSYQQKIIEANKLKVILKDDLKIEINSEVVLNDYVKEIINGELLNGDDIIDTSKLGEKELTLLMKNKHDEEEKDVFKVVIVDTTKPIIDGKGEFLVYVGNNVNLLDGVSVTDNSNEEISAKVVGDYDVSKVGSYNLKWTAEDSSGNVGEKEFVLNVAGDPNNRTFTTSKGFSGKVVNGVTYIDGYLIANKTYALPSSYGNGLTWETQNAFNRMHDDAQALGLTLWLASGYRSYYDQKYIYNNYVKWDGQANADTYSARAGHSEHQTGLAFDLNTIDDSFTNTDEGKWVHDNCYNYGLILRYPLGKDNITGYKHESWHMRYVGEELAKKLYNGGDWITMEEYFGIDSKYS